MRKVLLGVLLFVCVSTFGSDRTRRQQLFEPKTNDPALALFDLSGADSDNLNTALFFPSPSSAVLSHIPGVCTDPTAFKALRETNEATDRWISVKGSTVKIEVVYDSDTDAPTIEIKEDPRDTRLSTDFATLVKIVKAVGGVSVVEKKTPSYQCLEKTYQLTRTRATLKITVTHSVSGKDTTVDKTITTGPTEHLFLSADVPVTKLKQLKYDNSSSTVTTKDAPTAFYAGFDYTIGDILTSDPEKKWEGIVFKALLKVSKKPLDGYGGAIGYRSPKFGILGMTFDAFTPFVGYFWTKYDDKDAAGKPITRTKNGIRFGVSFNLDKALDWTKSGS